MKKILLLASLLIVPFLSTSAKAGVLYWNPEGTAAQTTANLTGTWDGTTTQWSSTSAQTASPVAWVSGDAACFCAQTGTAANGAFTVTLNSTLTVAGIFNGPLNPAGFNVTIAGSGTMVLPSGTTQGISSGGSDGLPTTVNVPIAGSATLAIEGSAQTYLNGVNTYSGGTTLGYGPSAATFTSIVNFNNSASFGTGPIWFSDESGGAMVEEGSSAITIANPVIMYQAGNVNLNIVGNTAGVTFSGPWTLNGASLPTFAGAVSVPTVGQVSVSSGGAANALVTISGTISGTSNFNKYGVGILVLSGANNYTGITSISNGILQVASAETAGVSGPLGASAASNPGSIVLRGGTLQFSAANQNDYSGRFSAASSQTYNIDVNGQSVPFVTALSSTGAPLNVSSSAAGGVLTLSAANTYSGNTAVNAGATLVLGAGGSINSSPNLLLAAGGTFDVSALDPFTLNPGTALNAKGTGTTQGTTAAVLNDSAVGGVINVNTNQINLAFTPAAFTGDTTHPALVVLQGALTLNNNQIVVTNAAGTALGVGTYNLIQVGDGTTGTISGTPNPDAIMEGTGLAAGTVGVVSVVGSEVVLTVSTPANPTTTTLSAMSAINYGSGSSVTATATVSPAPDSGEVQFFVNNVPLGSPVTVDTGTGVASYTYTPPANTPAANYSVTADYSGSSDATYSDSSASAVTLAVSKVPLTITANAQSVTYGTAATTGTGKTTFTTSGLQNGETIGSVTLTALRAGYISTNTPVAATYTITPSAATGGTFSSANYTITYATGNLAVTTKALTVTATAESMTYGQTYTGFGTLKTTNFTGSGFVNGQTAASMTVTLTCPDGTATTSAGPYTSAIVPSAAAELSGKTNFNAANYAITYTGGTFTVNKATLRIGATPLTAAYGTPVSLVGSVAFTNTTLSNSETVGSVTLVLSGTNVGANTITPSAATGGSGTESDYTITYVASTLTVTPLTAVLAGSQVYAGTTNVAAASLTVADLVGNDNVTVATGVGGMASQNIGTNAITSVGSLALGGTKGSNYSLAGASGSVVVTPLAVTLSGTREYDGSNDASATILAVANDFDGTNLTLSGSAVLAGSGVGSENVSDASGLSLGGSAATNYSLAGASGAVTVTTAPLSITAYPVTKNYGTVLTLDPTAFTVGSGLMGSETVTSATMTASGGVAAGDPVSGSPYTVTPSAALGTGGFAASNYNISYNSDTLTVLPLSVVLTGGRPYDGTAQAASSILSVSNAVSGDDVNLASGAAALAAASVGPEAITDMSGLVLGGVTAGNYSLVGGSGMVMIANPYNSFTITSSGFDVTGTNFVVNWQSVPGVVYTVMTNSDVTSTNWGVCGSTVTATGTTASYVLPGGKAGGNVFIRIRQQ